MLSIRRDRVSQDNPLSVILSEGEAVVELLRVECNEQAKACVRRTRGISLGVFVSSCKKSYIMWADSKIPYEIPSSLSLLGFGSDRRRLAAHSLSKTSTSLRMTDRGIVRRLTKGSPSGGAPAKRVRGEWKSPLRLASRATSPKGRGFFSSPRSGEHSSPLLFILRSRISSRSDFIHRRWISSGGEGKPRRQDIIAWAAKPTPGRGFEEVYKRERQEPESVLQ